MNQASGMLPFRATLEKQGYAVYFDGKNKTALALKPGKAELFVDYGNGSAFIGSKKIGCKVRLIRRRIYLSSEYFTQILS